MASTSIGGRRRPQPTARQYVVGGATAAASGALNGALRVIGDYVVAKGSTSLSLGAVGNAAFASGGVALGIFALYSIGSYAISQMAEREKMVFMVDPSKVYNVTSNQARYLETIPVTYGTHIIYPTSVTTSRVDIGDWANYDPATVTGSSGTDTKKSTTRVILCVGSGEYMIDVLNIRVGQNSITTTEFMSQDDGMTLSASSASVVGPGETFRAEDIEAVRGTNVAGFQGLQFNPLILLSTAGVGVLDGNPGRNLFTSFTSNIGTNSIANQKTTAKPEIAIISSPSDTVENVDISFYFEKRIMNNRNALSDGITLGVQVTDPETLVSDYIVTGTFIQAKSDGTLINDDGTPVPLVNAKGQLAADVTQGLYPQNIRTITGAVPWTHSTAANQTKFSPSQHTATDALRRRVLSAGFNYVGVSQNDPTNVGFVFSDRRHFRHVDQNINESTNYQQRFVVRSANLPPLGDSTLVPRAERVWILLLVPYHLIHTDKTSGSPVNLRDSCNTILKIAQISVKKTSPDINPYYNSALRNVSDYTFIQAKVPGVATFDNLETLFQNADRDKINAIVTRKLRVYKNDAWTTATEVTESPIWAVADIFTSSVGGKLDHDTNLVGSEMEQLAQYYENEGLHYNEVIDSPQGTLDLINNIGSLFDFMVYQHGSRWRLTRDFYASNIEYLIFESDCVDNIDATYQANQENVDNILDISYLEGKTWLKSSVIVPADYYQPGVDPENVTQFQIRGLTELNSIRRFARSRLLKSRYRRQVLNVTLREIGMILKPNDTIGLVHSYFTEEYAYGQVISSERINGVDFLTTDTDTDIRGVGNIIFRNENGTPSHQLSAERVSANRFRIDDDLQMVDLITDPSRIRTAYSFALPTKILYNRCKVMSVAPNGVFSYNVTMLIDRQEAYV